MFLHSGTKRRRVAVLRRFLELMIWNFTVARQSFKRLRLERANGQMLADMASGLHYSQRIRKRLDKVLEDQLALTVLLF